MSEALLTVVRSLSFAEERTADLDQIPEREWRRLLPLTDRAQLTLPLGVRGLHHLPGWVQERISGNLANNAIRHQRTLETYQHVANALSARGVEFVVLKGLTQWPFYCDQPRHRPQYDLDLYCAPAVLESAFQSLLELGYEPFGDKGRTAVDHLPPMIRKTGWRARGDYYDPDMPLTIELHFRLWDPGTERFNAGSAGKFWTRRRARNIEGLLIPALDFSDGLAYATWHMVRHLVRGDLRAYHVYELAHFLDRTSRHDDFWREWRATRLSPLVEAIAFRMAIEWFQPRTHPTVTELSRALPPPIARWFELFGFSPLLALQQPNKNELFLHFCLVKGWQDRFHIAKRRLFPMRLNPVVVDAHVPAPSPGLKFKRVLYGAGFTAMRALHHSRTLVPVILQGLRWRRELAR
jgi:hypothetical protein